MNYSRLALAALGGTVAAFAFGFLTFWLLPVLSSEPRKYPALFRGEDDMKSVMPIGFVATLIEILVVAVIFAMIHPNGSSAAGGAVLGLLIGVLVVCASVLKNYVNLNIGVKLTVVQAGAYFAQWIIVCTVIGLIYKPVAMG